MKAPSAGQWPGTACVLLGLGLLHMLALFNAGAYIATLPSVAAGLTVPPSFGTWTQTDFMIGLALGVPLARAGAGRWGDAWVFRTAAAGFAAASAGCALAAGLHDFLAGRIFLGLFGGMALPAGQRLFVRACLAHGWPHGPLAWGLLALSPFSLGTAFGGWLTDAHGWRALFVVNLPCALLALLLTSRAWHGDARAPRPAHVFDWIEFALLSTLLLGLQTLLNLGNDFDWLQAPVLRALAAVLLGTLAAWALWTRQRREGQGFHWSFVAAPDFAVALPALVLGFLCFQGLLSLLIVQVQLTLGYSATAAGQIFLPMVVGGFPVALAIQRWARPADVRWLASLGLFGLSLVYLWIGRFEQPHAFGALLVPKVAEGAAIALALGPLGTLLVRQLPHEQQAHAAEFGFALRLAAGAIGITVAGVVLYRQAAFHQSRFVELLSPLDPAQLAWRARLAGAGLNQAQIPLKLTQIVTQHARLMAIGDAFRWAGWLCAGLGTLLWLPRLAATLADTIARPASGCEHKQDPGRD